MLMIGILFQGIQELLNEPNPRSPANGQASDMFVKKKADYSRKIKQQAAKFAPDIQIDPDDDSDDDDDGSDDDDDDDDDGSCDDDNYG